MQKIIRNQLRTLEQVWCDWDRWGPIFWRCKNF